MNYPVVTGSILRAEHTNVLEGCALSTSEASYYAAMEEGLITEKQNMVIAYMLKHKDRAVYCGEVVKYYNDTNHSISPRFIELEECEIIKCVGTVYNEKTNRHVQAYRLTGKIPTERVRRKKKTNKVYALCHIDMYSKALLPEVVYSTYEKAQEAGNKMPEWYSIRIVELEVK